MENRPAISVREYQRLSSAELRADFVLENLFAPGQSQLTYWETDRTVVGSIVPMDGSLRLETAEELASDFFCERREVGVINIGGPGAVVVDRTHYKVNGFDCLYIGRGSRDVSFHSDSADSPAKFYLMSYPAHAKYPTTFATPGDANQLHLGNSETANERTIFQFIHEKGIQSCQLVMGFTRLQVGSVWNTMPPHTHSRRCEVYLYCEVPEEAAVFHFMGPGNETRNLLMHSEQVVLSPSWSVHCGCGTQAYSFIWAMGGENQRFDDMDGIAIADLR